MARNGIMLRQDGALINTSNSRPWRSIGSFMYIGSAGPGPGGRTDGRTGGRRVPGHGRADGRADGRAAGTILNDSTTIFIDFQKNIQNSYVFLSFRIRRKRKYRFLQVKSKRCPKNVKQTPCFLTFQIRRTRKYRFLLIKTRFLNTSPDPADTPDPAEMEHELRLATHQQRAGGQDDGSLNKLPQMRKH